MISNGQGKHRCGVLLSMILKKLPSNNNNELKLKIVLSKVSTYCCKTKLQIKNCKTKLQIKNCVNLLKILKNETVERYKYILLALISVQV